MSSIYQNPENALKRAETLYDLGKQDEAMDCLYDVLKNRKNRLLKQTHEAIINKLLEICVERKLSGFAKDGLYLYRIICQGVNIKSWEDAVKKLFLLAESKIETTIKDLQTSLVDFCSLDQAMTPESLMKISCSDESETRRKQILLLSWIKFKWECYRICVELLRNTQFEKFYHYIVQSAFKFCLKYSRKTEFRKLCNSLKMHVNYLQKRHAEFFTDDKNSEVTTLYLETGISELNTALELELWHDAFKVAEDIHFLMSIVKQTINSKVMAIYYEKLSILFWKGSDLLFHAAALFQYFLFSKEVKKTFTSETSALSSRVVLAVLSIPFDSDILDSVTENNSAIIVKKQRLLSSLLNFSNIPTRKLLMKNLNIYNILQSSHPEIQDLFNLLENEVDPLNMNVRLKKSINSISELDNQITSKQYFPSLFAVSTVRLLSQLSMIYETLTLSKFFSLVPFVEPCFIERFVVDSARRYNIPVRIDQANKSLRFNNSFCLFQSESTIGGPEFHQLPENQNLNWLTSLLNSLNKIKNLIIPDSFKFESVAHAMHLQEQYFKSQNIERRRILQRKKLIEKYKEMLENLQIKKEKEERKRLAEQQSKQEATERYRLRKEAEERAYQRRILEEEKIKNQILREKIENLKKSELGQMIEKLELNELSSVDPDSLLSKHIEYIKREKKEFQTRLRKQERTINHMERAKRIEEIPLLKQEYEVATIKALEMWEHDEKCRIQRLNEERSRLIEDKNRMLSMKDDLNAFMLNISERRKLEYEKDYMNFLRTIQKEREKRLLERAVQRKTERRRIWLEQKKQSEKDNDAHFKLVRRRETRNNAKSIREKSAEKSPGFENFREFRTEQNNSLPYKPYQEKLIKTSNQESTRSLPTRHNDVNMFDNQSRRRYDFQTNIAIKRDESPYKKTQPKYHILKRNENPFIDKRISKEHFLPTWCTSSDLRNDDTDFQKSFFGCADNPNAQSPKRQNTKFISSSRESTTPVLEPSSKYMYSQKHCQAESLQRKDTLPDSLLYKKNMNSEFHLDSTGKISKRDDEKAQSNVGEQIKYDVRHSCTPWAKLNRANNAKPNNES
ncbi:Eukaryotic translation initiation factor 3 subunit A [Araneus ventricosus]|uniref:Eukaryotic translation initiation factor 3 subunit A n=1 Tax=Araneus ventricosus TaxID=182803 RepID=A0A4Y2S9S1_ARAVE|nr:Eukaryotic translation initiation factor 3 subunit A [Araneus ventricosus]GBN84988.1 Eukaryotic translation initiation factor 3 subunit A [Araneus ventricosus]